MDSYSSWEHRKANLFNNFVSLFLNASRVTADNAFERRAAAISQIVTFFIDLQVFVFVPQKTKIMTRKEFSFPHGVFSHSSLVVQYVFETEKNVIALNRKKLRRKSLVKFISKAKSL